MINIAIYDVQETVGQALCDFSENFPGEYRRDLEGVSAYFGEPDISERTMVPALRYSPLKDKYLFSLTTRVEKGRLYNRVVHYLVDRTEADTLLDQDLRGLYSVLVGLSFQSAQEQWVVLQNMLLDLDDCTGGVHAFRSRELPAHVQVLLMTGASLPDQSQKVRLVCSDVKEFPFLCLNWLRDQLPANLRRQIRFNTNAVCPSEAKGLSLVFCSEEGNQTMERMSNSGGDRANVFVSGTDSMPERSIMKQEIGKCAELMKVPDIHRSHAGMLLQEDEGWPEYFRLAALPYETPSEAIHTMIKYFGAERTADFLNTRVYSPEELFALHSAAPGWLKNCYPVRKVIHRICDPDKTFSSLERSPEIVIPEPRPEEKRSRLSQEPDRERTGFFRKLILPAVGLVVLVGLLIVIVALIGGGLIRISDGENVLITAEAAGQVLSTLLAALLGGLFGALLTVVIRWLKDLRGK